MSYRVRIRMSGGELSLQSLKLSNPYDLIAAPFGAVSHPFWRLALFWVSCGLGNFGGAEELGSEGQRC